MLVTSYTRQPGESEWRLRDFTELEDEISILGEGVISMKDLYRKIPV